jgi:hypothetical protein
LNRACFYYPIIAKLYWLESRDTRHVLVRQQKVARSIGHWLNVNDIPSNILCGPTNIRSDYRVIRSVTNDHHDILDS